MKIAVVIETVTRSESYLDVTLKNFLRAGGYCAPELHSIQISNGDGLTRQQNGQRAIALGAATDADWVLKLEDDLDFVGDFLGSVRRWTEDHVTDQIAMSVLGATFERVSDSHYQPGENILGPGTSFPYARRLLARGERVSYGRVTGFWGAQALLWRRRTAERLAMWMGDDPYFWDGREQHRDRGHDLLIGQWAIERGLNFAAPVPSFVQHIGERSTIANKFFQFPWPGREWTYQREA